jgi:hypothetical protein
MKRESLTKCLQLAHDLNDQEVIDLISSKYRVAKVVVAQINVPPVPGRESWTLYQYNKFSSDMGGGPGNLVAWYMKTFPESPLIAEGALLEKLEDKIRHVELWNDYEANQNSSRPSTRSNAEKEYAEKYKAEIDPSWNVGELKEPKNPITNPANNIYIHEYIKHAMEEWYSSLDPKNKKNGKEKVKVGEGYDPSQSFYTWWKNLSELYKDDTRVQAALNAQHTVYLEPESYAAASAKTRITVSQLDPRYSRMMPEKISLYNLGLEENLFPVFGPSKIKYGSEDKQVTYHNPDRQNLDKLISELQDALLGIVRKEPKERKEVDYTKGLKFLSNLLSYKGGII